MVPVSPRDIDTVELLEDGEPLRTKGGSPWGNRDRGVLITGGRLHQHLYVSPSSGEPSDHRYALRLQVRRKGAGGLPLVTLDPTDQMWCYGGSSRPFRRPYAAGWRYPVMTLYHGFRGYGLWAFYHWNKTEKIMWLDPETLRVTISPVYCGYRDGWRDALLLSQLRETKGEEALGHILGEKDKATLRVAFESREVYTFRTVANAADPVARNAARRQALEALSSK